MPDALLAKAFPFRGRVHSVQCRQAASRSRQVVDQLARSAAGTKRKRMVAIVAGCDAGGTKYNPA